MNIEYNVLVNLKRPYQTNAIVIPQGDTETRTVVFYLMGISDEDMQAAKMVDVEMIDPNKKTTVLSNVATIVTETDGDETTNTNKVRLTIPVEATYATGRTTLRMVLLDGTDSNGAAKLATWEYYIDSRNEQYRNPNEDNTVEDLSSYHDMMNRMASALKEIQALVVADKLPNPYPFRLTIGDKTYSYNGAETVEVTLSDIEQRIDDIEDSYAKDTDLETFKTETDASIKSVTDSFNKAVPFSFGMTDAGEYGYKKTGADTVTPFRNPKGNATASDVLAGKTFANSDSDSITGTMPNRGSVTLTPIDGGTVSAPAGYYSEIKADGSKAYAAARAVKVGSVTGSGTLNCTGIAGWQNLTVNNFLCVPNANASASSTADSNHTDQWTAGTASSNSNFYRPYASSYSNGIVTISGGSFEGHTYLSNLGQTFGSGTKITCDVWIIH